MNATRLTFAMLTLVVASTGACADDSTIDPPAHAGVGGDGTRAGGGDGGLPESAASPSSSTSTRADGGATTDGATSSPDATSPVTTGKDGGPSQGSPPLVPPTCVDTSKLPAWRKTMAVGEWRELASADLASVVPTTQPGGYYSARIDAWNGFAADTVNGKLYLGGAGGHADYAGNEVYSIDLNAAAPSWVLEAQPTPSSSYTIDKPLYLDGRPSPTHTYYTLWFIEGRQKLFRFGGGATWGSGNGSTDHIESWNPATKDWDVDGTNPRLPAPTYEQPTTKHPYSGDVYQIGSDNHLRRWSQASGTVSDLGDAQAGTGSFYDFYKSPSVIDPVGERLFLLSDGSASAGSVRVYDIKKATWSVVALSGGQAAAVAARESQAMGYYDTCAKKMFVKTTTGAEVLVLDPTNMATTTLATSGASVVDAVNGVHTLFQSLPSLGGYAYQPRHSAKLYFLATQ
ncbi:MAG: hypothetical protein U0235_09720 [Polyangiaceae bacterium]